MVFGQKQPSVPLQYPTTPTSIGLSDQAPRMQYQPPAQSPLGSARPSLPQNLPGRHGVHPLSSEEIQIFLV